MSGPEFWLWFALAATFLFLGRRLCKLITAPEPLAPYKMPYSSEPTWGDEHWEHIERRRAER